MNLPAPTKSGSSGRVKPGKIGIAAIYLAYAAVLLRTFGIEDIGPLLTWYLVGEFFFIVLYSLVIWKYNLPTGLMHFYFAVQTALIVALLFLWSDFDFITVFFILLSYQSSLVFTGRIRWIWIGMFIFAMGGSLIYFYGLLQGLALSLTNIAACIIIPAYFIANHEIEQARMHSQRLLNELQEAHKKSQEFANQVDELTTIQERNRLARELHDTVSQLIFTISLNTRSAQLLLEQDPSRLPEQLKRLQEITANALAQMRSLITQLRPPVGS